MARRPGLRAHVRGGAGGGTRQPVGEMRSPSSIRWAVAKAKDDAKFMGHETFVVMDKKSFAYEVQGGRLYSFQVLIATVQPSGSVEYTPLGKLKAKAAKGLADPKIAAKVKRMVEAKERPRVSKQKKFTMTQVIKAAGYKSGKDPRLNFRIGRDIAVSIISKHGVPTQIDNAAMAALRLADRHSVKLPGNPVVMAKLIAKVATVVGLGSIDQAMEGWRIVLGLDSRK